MLLGFGIPVLLGHTEIDDVDHIGGLRARATDEEVVGLDITVDEVLLVNGLDARELQSQALVARPTSGSPINENIHTICLATMTTVLVENRRLQ